MPKEYIRVLFYPESRWTNPKPSRLRPLIDVNIIQASGTNRRNKISKVVFLPTKSVLLTAYQAHLISLHIYWTFSAATQIFNLWAFYSLSWPLGNCFLLNSSCLFVLVITGSECFQMIWTSLVLKIFWYWNLRSGLDIQWTFEMIY